jgi:cell division protein FtsB
MPDAMRGQGEMTVNDATHTDYETIRTVLRQQLPDTSLVREELMRLVDEAERREAAEREKSERLHAENERLKQELRKLRTAQAGAMSSRLRDALRE